MNLDFMAGLIIGAAGGMILAFFVSWAVVSIRERREIRRTKGKHGK